jgi:hypothetical protein
MTSFLFTLGVTNLSLFKHWVEVKSFIGLTLVQLFRIVFLCSNFQSQKAANTQLSREKGGPVKCIWPLFKMARFDK